jgi:hypothetical protein
VDATTPLIERSDRGPLAALFAFALGGEIAVAGIGARGGMSSLGVYFDVYLYLEIDPASRPYG